MVTDRTRPGLRRAAGVSAVLLLLMLLGLPVARARADLADPAPLCGSTVTGTATTATTLKVGTFNVLHGLTDDGESSLEARLTIQISQIAASGANVLGLQEVGESTNHERVIERLADGLAATTGEQWHWCWFRTEPHAPGVPDTAVGGGDPASDMFARFYNAHETMWYEGAAVLSRFAITASAAHRLPGEDVPGRLTGECIPAGDPTCVLDLLLEPRAAVWARVQLPTESASIVAAHTSGNSLQHADLVRWARQRSAADPRAFVLCDCNATPDSDAYAVLADGGYLDAATLPGADAGPTADQDLHAAQETVTDRIDYVWIRDGAATEPSSVLRFMRTPVDGLWPSDHFGVLATFG